MENILIDSISPTKRSLLRQLEELLPQIEDGLARGYPHSVMHAELPTLGITISLPYYHRALRLLRKERREQKRLFGSTPPSELVQLKGTQFKDSQLDNARVTDLSTAFEARADETVSKIVEVPTETKKFRWSGKEISGRDWTQF
jgi:hypothetical protein